MRYKMAVAQMDTGSDTRVNREKTRQYIREAAGRGADFIVFPEHADYLGRDHASHAVLVPGEMTRFFASCAEKYGIQIHCGTITEQNPGRNPYNTSVLFSSRGEILGCYRKLHLFDVALEGAPGYRESDEASPGDEIVLCDTEFGRIGMAVCYDLRFPELFRLLAKQGAELIVLPANFTEETGRAHWETLVRARAIENTCFVAAAGQCGKKDAFASYGHSMIVDPWGNVLAEAGSQEEILYADIDTDRIRQVREQIPSLSNVREDVYRLKGESQMSMSEL